MVIKRLNNGRYRIYSHEKNPKTGKRRNLGTFDTSAAAIKHERAINFFKHRQHNVSHIPSNGGGQQRAPATTRHIRIRRV